MFRLTNAVLRGSDAIDAREDKFPYDRNKFMNASEAGSCIRKQWFSKRGKYTAGVVEDWGFARRGKNAERYVVECLKAANVPVMLAGAEQYSFFKGQISGTPDGVLLLDEDKMFVPFEIKSIDPRTNTAKLPKPEHVLQLQINMALLREGQSHTDEFMMDLKPKGWTDSVGLLLYIDASNYNQMYQFEIKADSRVLKRMSPRAKTILGSKTPGALDREGKRDGGCTYCPFTEACGVSAADVSSRKPVAKGNRGSKLETVVSRYATNAETVKSLEDENATLKEDIKNEIKARTKKASGQVTVGDFEVVLEVTAGRTSFDKKAAKDDGVDVSKYEKTGAPGERLTVKRVA